MRLEARKTNKGGFLFLLLFSIAIHFIFFPCWVRTMRAQCSNTTGTQGASLNPFCVLFNTFFVVAFTFYDEAATVVVNDQDGS